MKFFLKRQEFMCMYKNYRIVDLHVKVEIIIRGKKLLKTRNFEKQHLNEY